MEEPQTAEPEEAVCPICLDILGECFAQLCQSEKHRVCPPCFQSLLKKSIDSVICPCCRFQGQFVVEPDPPKMVFYSAQKRNRFLQIGDRTLQVIVQTEKKISEQRARAIIGSAANLIERLLIAQAEGDENEIVTFTKEDSDIEVVLNRNVVIFSL
jgi:hypothetical protein